ncbi:asparagine synthase-related protein [Streptomyces iconiensis]|uniref:asparagine synthase (glutamine-hydrolyzing) n=1 Tax=Streptomyces iconiensis TaxID=1384038 RepID=A0ABT6ZV00_9ACTN|nr:asparagine synthase-related protein [Streptomyces iconiensis]MDJ1132892.1 asparagine synthase-related protein [Streptomyces iconiensis]
MYWFVALPDCPVSRPILEELGGSGVLIADHASGRPWLAGRLPATWVRIHTEGAVRLAVLGRTAEVNVCAPGAMRARGTDAREDDSAPLLSALGRIRDLPDLNDLDALAASARGSCHMVLSAHGKSRAQGTASGLRRLYRARHHGVTVLADRADVLARLTGASVETRALAAQLLVAGPPSPLDELSCWTGIEAVPSGSAVTVDHQGDQRLRSWWQLPAAEAPLKQGSLTVAEALSAAVDDRVRAERYQERTLGCDLSGGLDSTSLAFLAAPSCPLATLTVQYTDAANDDPLWAARARQLLPSVGTEGPSLFLAGGHVPAQYAAAGSAPSPTDAPSPLLRGRAVLDAGAAEYTRHGISLHLAGHGGDEVLQATPGYLHGLVRRQPAQAVRHMRGHRARRHWSLGSTLRALTDSRPYGRWLADEARLLRAPERASAPFGWGEPVRLPPWAGPEAETLVAGLLNEAADSNQPLSADRGQHHSLHRVRSAAQIYRLMRQELHTPWVALPFLDDRVVEACLAVRPSHRGTPYAYKQLLTTAMRSTVPGELLARTTKGSTDTDFYDGLRAHRGALAALVDRSELAARGLIEPAALRRALLVPAPHTSTALEDTLACEHWLLHCVPEPLSTDLS